MYVVAKQTWAGEVYKSEGHKWFSTVKDFVSILCVND